MSSFVELQNSLNPDEYENEDKRQRRNYRQKLIRFLRNRVITSVFFLIVFSVTIPVLIFFVLFHIGYSANEQRHTCLVEASYRVPCGAVNISSEECNSVHCCFDEDTEECYHYIPSLYYYQAKINSEIMREYSASQNETPFHNANIDSLAVSVVELDENKLKIVLHRTNVSVMANIVDAAKSYNVKIYDEDYLYVQVTRTSTNDTLFTTHKGPLIASVGYWEWTFQLTTEHLFGFGKMSFTENTTYTKVVYKNKDDHNSLPIFMAYVNGSYHGAIVEHEGPLEVTVLPSYLIILRSIVGESISITLMTGPRPADIVKQQRVLEPSPLPYWALGPHICRQAGDDLTEALEHYYSFIDDSVEYASDCIHENLVFFLHNANETLKNNVAEAIADLRTKSRFVLSFQPQVEISDNPLYEAAFELDLFYKDAIGEPLNGSYKGSQVAFIDFSVENAHSYFDVFHDTVLQGIDYDGVTLTDNWPAEDTYIIGHNHTFPYLSEFLNSSLSKTIPWNASSTDYELHITKHNSYGTSQLQLFENRLTNEEFLMTASYDYGVSQAALIQDIDISWENLRNAIKTVLYNSILGSPITSIPICGSTENYNVASHEIICIRWYIMAATSPLFRISSVLPLRDPGNLTTGYAKNAALKAIAIRKMLSLYFHTVLRSGQPLMRPLFYDFYDDNNTLTLDTEYMVGPALLVAQIVLPEVNTISLYLPPSGGVWYEYFGGGNYTELGWKLFSVVETDWLMFVLQGYIIPLIRDINDNESATDTIMLAIALNCTDGNICNSNGKLQYNSVDIALSADAIGLTITNANNAVNDIGCGSDMDWPRVIDTVIIYGIEEKIVQITLGPVDLCNIVDNEYFIAFDR